MRRRRGIGSEDSMRRHRHLRLIIRIFLLVLRIVIENIIIFVVQNMASIIGRYFIGTFMEYLIFDIF